MPTLEKKKTRGAAARRNAGFGPTPEAVWARLSPGRRFEIVREVVLTRGHELRRAFHGVTGIAAGLRVKRGTGGKRVLPEPCVRFEVRKKISVVTLERKGLEPIPRSLLAMSSIGKPEWLCAVPTDVQVASERKIVTQAGGPARVTSRFGATSIGGTAACLVEIPSRSAGLHLAGCHHVLALSKALPAVPSDYVQVTLSSADSSGISKRVGRLAYTGRLQSDLTSHDAALVKVDPTREGEIRADQAFRQAYRAESAIRYLTKGQGCVVVTSHGDIPVKIIEICANLTLGAANVATMYARSGEITLKNVFAYEFDGPLTLAGDSGAPVLSRTGRVLFGMHFALMKETFSNGVKYRGLAVSSDELLRCSNYATGEPDEMLRVVPR